MTTTGESRIMPGNLLKRYSLSIVLAFSAAAFTGCAARKPAGEFNSRGTFLYNEQRLNVSPEKVRMPVVLSWTKDISSFRFLRGASKEQLSAPALANGLVYVGSEDNTFYSLDLASGRVLWKYDAGYPVDAPPSASGATACFGSADGVMRCFESLTGKELWRFQARSEIVSSPLITGEMVYFSSSDDRFYALGAGNGEKVWSYTRGTYQTVAPRAYASPAYSDKRLYQFFSDGYLVCLSADTGKEVWAKKVLRGFDSAQQTRRTPLIYGGLVYMIDDNNAIEALDASTGEVKNLYSIIKAHDFVIPDKRMLVMAGSEQAVAIDRATGSILWKREFAKKPLSSVFAADDTLFILSNYRRGIFGTTFMERDHGYIEALDMKTGEAIWGMKLKSSVSANGSASGLHIAVLTDKGRLEVFGSK